MGVESRDSITGKNVCNCDVYRTVHESGMAGAEWKNEEPCALLTIWGEDWIQHAMNVFKRNKLGGVHIIMNN